MNESDKVVMGAPQPVSKYARETWGLLICYGLIVVVVGSTFFSRYGGEGLLALLVYIVFPISLISLFLAINGFRKIRQNHLKGFWLHFILSLPLLFLVLLFVYQLFLDPLISILRAIK